MAEVASAFVSLVPSARGFGRGTQRQIGGEVATAGKNLGRTLGRSMFAAAAAVGAAVGVSRLISGSLSEARESQKVGALTTQVIKSTGGAANVTAKQVGNLSTAISNKVGVDDEAIQSGENMLLTFKNIRNESGKGNKIFSRAARTTTDLAAAMAAASGGELNFRSAAIQIGKALNDPVKGITALTRVGVTFDDQQKKQIETLVKHGKTMDAQKIILRELNSEFGGAAAAQATAGDKARVAFLNLKETLGNVLLPVIDRLARFFTNRLAPALTTIIQSIGPAGRRIRTFFSKQIIPVVSTIGGDLGKAATKVKNFFKAGAGHAALAKSFGAISTAAGHIRDGFGKAADALDRMKAAAQEIDFGNFDSRKVGEALGKALIEGIRFVGKNVGKITKTIGDLFGKVDWVGLGITIGKQAPALLLGLAAGILTFDPTTLLKGMVDHWATILGAVLLIAFAPSKLGGVLERVLGRIPFVGKFLAAGVRWLNELGSKLTGFGADLFRSFANGFGRVRFPGAGLIARVMSAFRALPGQLFAFLDLLRVRIGVWALDAFESMGRGSRTAVNGLLRFLGSLPRRIVSAVGDLSGVLIDAGEAIIKGLITGIGKGLKPLGDKLGKVGGFIKDHKGPPKADAIMLRPAGRLIMGGLSAGINDGLPDLRHQLQRVSSNIRVTPVAPRLGGHSAAGLGGPLVNVETLVAHDYADFMRQSQLRARQASLGGIPARAS